MANPSTKPRARKRFTVNEYPRDHQFGMEVPVGGSNCDKCEYLAGDRKCGNEYFIKNSSDNKPAGSDRIPMKTDRYCCDVFDEKKPKREGAFFG